MIKSQPIKSVDDIQSIKSYFLKERTRDYLLFVLGINVPLKLQDILTLKVEDLKKSNGKFIFNIQGYTIYLNLEDSKILDTYIKEKSSGDYIFESIKTKSPMTRQQFHRILTAAADAMGCEYSIGPQALKKTFAYHAYHQGIHIFDLMHMLGHQTKAETYRFIDVLPPDNKHIEIKI